MAKQFPIYIGWIYGNLEDRETLISLGVGGHMIWSQRDYVLQATVGKKLGIFEHCECSKETLDNLEKEYPTFARSTFTETDERAYRKYRQQFEEETDEDHTD